MPTEFHKTRVELTSADAVINGFRLWNPSVEGIEVTQSLQYYRSAEHLTDPGDRGPDNGVHLVAYKSAWVRVYVRAGLLSSGQHVTATLEVARRNERFIFDRVTTLSPFGGATITTDPTVDYGSERASLWRTLNFIIPASEFRGTLRLTAQLAGFGGASHSVIVSVHLVQTLRIRAVMVAYDGPSTSMTPAVSQPPAARLVLPAPTLADLMRTASKSLAAMPVQTTGSFASAGTLNWATPLDDARTGAGGCSINWNAILIWLALLQDNDGNRADVVYFGLLPSLYPLGVPGCGGPSLGAGAVDDQDTLMHEIGHGYGFMHTPCGPGGATDPDYPVYEPYASASIGEYGLDIRDGGIQNPLFSRDYMSYCLPGWMSLYHQQKLISHPRLAPRWLRERIVFDDVPVAFDPEWGWWPDPPWVINDDDPEWRWNPVVSLVGELTDDRTVLMTSVARIRVASEPTGVDTGFVAQLLDESGATIARAPLYRLDTRGGCGCGGADSDPSRGPFRFKAHIPDVGPGAAIRIVDGETELWSRRPESDPPRFVTATVDVDGDRLIARWEVESRAETTLWAQWSRDGAHWNGLAVGLAGGSAELPLTGLPAGRVFLRLHAHDGFFSTESEQLTIELPERAPDVAIMTPRDGQRLPVGSPIQIVGNAIDPAGMPVDEETLSWVIDGELRGTGREAWVSFDHEGRHEITLTVSWANGEEVRSIVVAALESGA